MINYETLKYVGTTKATCEKCGHKISVANVFGMENGKTLVEISCPECLHCEHKIA